MGHQAKYLVGGLLLKLAEELRGDDAREFYNAIYNLQRNEVNVPGGDPIAK